MIDILLWALLKQKMSLQLCITCLAEHCRNNPRWLALHLPQQLVGDKNIKLKAIAHFMLPLYHRDPNEHTTWSLGLYSLGNWTCMITAMLSSVLHTNLPSMKSDLIKIVWIKFVFRFKSLNLTLCVYGVWYDVCMYCRWGYADSRLCLAAL